jgi:hypothetical protein
MFSLGKLTEYYLKIFLEKMPLSGKIDGPYINTEATGFNMSEELKGMKPPELLKFTNHLTQRTDVELVVAIWRMMPEHDNK